MVNTEWLGFVTNIGQMNGQLVRKSSLVKVKNKYQNKTKNNENKI